MNCRTSYEATDLWRDALFERGVVTMVFQMPMDEARAFCLRDFGLALIGLNSQDAGYGRVFSLAHDLCHLCLDRPGVSGGPLGDTEHRAADGDVADLEQFCNQFAAAFLLPADDPQVQEALAAIARNPDPDTVRDAARRLSVSQEVALHRAADLGYIPDNVRRQILAHWHATVATPAARPGHPDPVTTRVSHLGKRFASLVFAALDARRITLYDAAQLLSLDPRHFPRARAKAVGGMTYAQ